MNIQINITENGRTILATAGKYCDRNVDVSVNVPSKDVELAEQKAITDSILDRSITEYVNDTLTKIGGYTFNYCTSLHTLYCPKVTTIDVYGLGNCKALQRVDFPKLYSIFSNAFTKSSTLSTLILRYNGVCSLKGTDAFNNTPIASGTGRIFVHNDWVDSYKTATNWSTFADQIKPISELGE